MGRKINQKKRGTLKNKQILPAIALVMFVVGVISYSYFSTSSSNGNLEASPLAAALGETLYDTNCSACHGIKGSGVIDDQSRTFLAPPLDESAHAWHHTDDVLADIILNGSPNDPRMIAWKSKLSEDDAYAIVTYIKSLWSPRIKACQGPKHMMCM